MTRSKATLLTIIAGLFAVTLPIVLALHLATVQGEDFEKQRVLDFAREALRRSERAVEQVYEAIDRLASAGHASCSDAELRLMREIDLALVYIQAIGRVSGNELVCSSLGRGTLALGEADVVTKTGTKVRSHVQFPFAKDASFSVIERQGYAAIVHKNLPVDIATSESDLSLATLTPDNRQLRSVRGTVRPGWLDALGAAPERAFIDGNHIVAVVRSSRYATAAIAALPIRHVEARVRSAALVLVPVGLAASGLLVWAILFAVRIQTAMPTLLKVALRRKEFFLEYQPIVDLRTRRWVGAEALIRWRRPNGNMVRPDLFIQVAEDNGLIERVTHEVLRLLARDAGDLFRRHPGFHLGINLSAADLQSKETIEKLHHLATQTGAGPGNLLVEATERGFLNAAFVRDTVRELRASGMRVAIDDFGTGYSSLSYLETFELDYLKIDKSFVDKIGTDAPTSQVAVHIIEMAKSLRMQMIAEGVETDAQAEFLLARGVQYAQGWLFSKPLPFSELAAKLAAQNPAPSAP